MVPATAILFLFFKLIPPHATNSLQRHIEKLSAAVVSCENCPDLLGDNLIKSYAEEARIEEERLPAKLTKSEKKRRLFFRRDQKNKKIEAFLDKTSFADPKVLMVDDKLVEQVFTSLAFNSVAKIDAEKKYDPRGDIGFCFGRALWAHSLLLQKKISNEQIAKIFVIGNLRHEEHLWDFHMATMVRGKGHWWVIDNLFEKPLPHQEWIKRTTKFALNQEFPEIRFYVTDPRKFQPGYGQYRLSDMMVPELESYFAELFSSVFESR